MPPGRQRAADLVLCAASIAWPLEVLVQFPLFGVDFLWVLAGLLAAILAPQAIANRKLRVPFEVWLPAVALAAASLVSGWPVVSRDDWNVIASALLFVLVVEAAPSRELMGRYFFLAALSAGAAALLSLYTPRLGLFPTAYSLRSGVTFTFAYDLAGGVHVLLLGSALAAYVASRRSHTPVWRTAASVVTLIVAVLLVGRSIYWWRDTGTAPLVAYSFLDPAEWVVAAAALWWVARVLAKAQVSGRAGLAEGIAVWWACALITLAMAACSPLTPRPYHGFLLGLACASALPGRAQTRAPWASWVAGVVAAVLLAANLVVVFPENVSDPRQYDAAASRDFPRVFERMDWVDRHARNERRTYLWRARAALEYGLPNLASFAFARAVSAPEGRPVLPVPSDFERQAFLVDIRDVTAALPEDRASCAYERVLLAMNERDATLHSLRLQLRGGAERGLFHVPTADAVPFAAVAGLIADDPLLGEELRGWTADEMVTLLIRWGADAAFSAEGSGADSGLFILAAQRRWDSLSVLVRVGERVTRFEEPLMPVSQRDVEGLEGAVVMAWSGPEPGEAGAARYTLNVAGEGGVSPAAHVDVRAEGAAVFSWVKDAPAIGFTPAVRIRVSR